MGRLQVQLVIHLDRDEAHVLALNGLSDRFRVDEVVLVRLYKGLHKLGWNQPGIVPCLRSARPARLVLCYPNWTATRSRCPHFSP